MRPPARIRARARTFSTAAAIKTWADRHAGGNPGAIRAATEFALEAIGIDGRGSRHTGAATHAEHYRKFVEDRVREILGLFTQRSDSSKLSNFWQSRETRDMRKPMMSLRDVDAGGVILGATRDPGAARTFTLRRRAKSCALFGASAWRCARTWMPIRRPIDVED